MNDDRKHLIVLEVEKLLVATKGKRNAARDWCLILLMFRHGLRVSEAVGRNCLPLILRDAACMWRG